MKLLVTGGAGFIGSHYVRRCSRMRGGSGPGAWSVLDKLTYAGNVANLAPVAERTAASRSSRATSSTATLVD